MKKRMVMVVWLLIFKPCFICHGRGHHLSHSQVNKVKEGCWDHKRSRINERCVERILASPPVVCELCHGDRTIRYPVVVNYGVV